MNGLGAIRTRWAAIGAAVAVTLGATGIGGYNLVNADVSSGERSVLVSITPCRLADTRPGTDTVGPRTSPLGAKDTMTISADGPGTPCAGKIPASATALALNVTAIDSTSDSFLTLWAGGDRPVAASLNPAAGEIVFNAVTTGLDASNAFKVYNEVGSTNVIADVTGYYDNHTHDDQYDKRITEVVVAGMDFTELRGTGWKIDLLWTHGGASQDCIGGPINVPPGRSIVGASLVYGAAAPVDLEATVIGTIQRPMVGVTELNSGQVVAKFDGTLPATGISNIVATPIAMTAPAPEISDRFTYGVFVCSRDSVNVASIIVELD